MASFMFLQRRQRSVIRRNRIFRDRTHPLEVYNDDQIFKKFRFHRQAILDLADSVSNDLEYVLPRQGSLSPVLQVLLALRFYATGAFQDVIADLIGVSQPTVCRTVSRVTDVLLRQTGQWIRMPANDNEANRNKQKFFARQGFPNVIGCIDGTHVRIQKPVEREHEFVNRKGYHSINVQVICDADLFINVIAKWPGSVHDARILRESPLFAAFEGNRPPLDGHFLGDSGYMLRSWLMTPVARPNSDTERRYNFAHGSTRATIERCIGVAKQRWHCLRCGLRFQPRKACRVILVCLMLHNRARRLQIPQPPPDSSDEDNDNSEDEAGDSDDDTAAHQSQRGQGSPPEKLPGTGSSTSVFEACACQVADDPSSLVHKRYSVVFGYVRMRQMKEPKEWLQELEPSGGGQHHHQARY